MLLRREKGRIKKLPLHWACPFIHSHTFCHRRRMYAECPCPLQYIHIQYFSHIPHFLFNCQSPRVRKARIFLLETALFLFWFWRGSTGILFFATQWLFMLCPPDNLYLQKAGVPKKTNPIPFFFLPFTGPGPAVYHASSARYRPSGRCSEFS